ncbi:MAG: putative cation transporter [Actinomycetia bacterium]|nr:putative cation transporter [Actinomycetes bacterium]
MTVIVAGASNLVVAAAKTIAGVVSGSAAMQAEAAHSVADTVTELFLFVANRRGGRGPDAEHPFGHGRETYVWAFLAALATFVAGSLFSLFRGVTTLVRGDSAGPGSLVISYAVLVFAFLVEGVSLWRGLYQARSTAGRLDVSPRTFLRITSDTPLKAVIFEDRAALAGLALAAIGLALWQATGQPAWDGASSLAIGVLLAVVAVSLARTNLSLLVGQRVPPLFHAALQADIESLPGVEAVPVFIVVVLGPGQMLVAAKVSFADNFSTADVERVADEAEARLRARSPGVRYVFLDPTA